MLSTERRHVSIAKKHRSVNYVNQIYFNVKQFVEVRSIWFRAVVCQRCLGQDFPTQMTLRQSKNRLKAKLSSHFYMVVAKGKTGETLIVNSQNSSSHTFFCLTITVESFRPLALV